LWRLAEQARLEVEAARRHAEEARGEAEAANRAKDTFLLTLSHELRTPLTPIFLWTGMLRQPDVPREVVARALDGIERGARSQTRLIEDLLDVSSIIAGKLHLELRPLALAEVVEAALEGVRAAASAWGLRSCATWSSATAGACMPRAPASERVRPSPSRSPPGRPRPPTRSPATSLRRGRSASRGYGSWSWMTTPRWGMSSRPCSRDAGRRRAVSSRRRTPSPCSRTGGRTS